MSTIGIVNLTLAHEELRSIGIEPEIEEWNSGETLALETNRAKVLEQLRKVNKNSANRLEIVFNGFDELFPLGQLRSGFIRMMGGACTDPSTEILSHRLLVALLLLIPILIVSADFTLGFAATSGLVSILTSIGAAIGGIGASVIASLGYILIQVIKSWMLPLIGFTLSNMKDAALVGLLSIYMLRSDGLSSIPDRKTAYNGFLDFVEGIQHEIQSKESLNAILGSIYDGYSRRSTAIRNRVYAFYDNFVVNFEAYKSDLCDKIDSVITSRLFILLGDASSAIKTIMYNILNAITYSIGLGREIIDIIQNGVVIPEIELNMTDEECEGRGCVMMGGNNSYSYIVNPSTGRKVNIHGNLGKEILRNYQKFI